MKLSSIADITSGTLIGDDLDIDNIVIDSRSLPSKSLFIAIRGDNHDGHTFVEAAIDNGAVAILVDRSIETTVPVIVVDDTQQALWSIAAAIRQHSEARCIAVTGSCGKTSTRAMLQSVFSQAGNTLASIASYNNHIGVPLTLLNLKPEHEFLISEIGTNHVGEIAPLAKMVKPDVSIITLIAPAHLEGFGTVDAVANEKADIYRQLPADGVAVINADEPYAEYFRQCLQGRRFITFGLSDAAVIRAEHIELDSEGRAHFTLVMPNGTATIALNCIGRHNVLNALAAAAAAYVTGLTLEEIQVGLQQSLPVTGRGIKQQLPMGAVVIDDTYNANPRSAEAALELLSHYEGESVFVIGDMGELGERTQVWHAKLGEQAKALGIHRLLSVGPLSAETARAFGDNGTNYETQEALISALRSSLHSKQTILVKGSNSMRMQRVVQALLEENQE